MISNEQIIRIIEESKRYCFSYLGYPFDHLMLTPIAMLDFKIVKTISLRGMLSNIFGTYDLMDLKKAFKEHKIVFASTVARKDVMLRMEVLKKDVPGSVFVPLFSLRTKRFVLSLPILFKAASVVRHSMKNYHGFKSFLYFTGYVYRYMNLYRLLDHVFSDVDINESSYMGSSSSTFDDVVFTEFFRKRGVATYHFTHAINFINYAIRPAFDFIAPYNITAETIMVWGKSSIKDIRENFPHLLDKRILVAGNNLMPDKVIKMRRTFTKGLVLLTGDLYYKENISLLYLIEEFSQKRPDIIFYIKLV